MRVRFGPCKINLLVKQNFGQKSDSCFKKNG